MSEEERYGTCSDEDGNWGVERLSDETLMAKGLVSHDAADCVIEMLEEIDRLMAEVERLKQQTDYERMYRETLAFLKQHNL